MSSVSLTGQDTIILDSRVLADSADGDVAVLEFPNDLCDAKVGKNGNVIFAFNASGKIVNATMRVLQGSADDKYLNSRVKEYINDPAGFILFAGEFIKRVGDGKGNISTIIYELKGGVPLKLPGAKENTAGDSEQAVAVYAFRFANNARAIA